MCNDVHVLTPTTAVVDLAVGADRKVDDLLRLIADPLRLRIVTLLAVEQLCTCHLVELTGARQTNISNHLRLLRAAGVVSAEPAGRFTYYRLEPAVMRRLSEHLSQLAAAAVDARQRRRPCD